MRRAAQIVGEAENLLTFVLQGVYQSHQAMASACAANNINLLRGMIGRPGAGILQMNGQPTATCPRSATGRTRSTSPSSHGCVTWSRSSLNARQRCRGALSTPRHPMAATSGTSGRGCARERLFGLILERRGKTACLLFGAVGRVAGRPACRSRPRRPRSPWRRRRRGRTSRPSARSRPGRRQQQPGDESDGHAADRQPERVALGGVLQPADLLAAREAPSTVAPATASLTSVTLPATACFLSST